MSKEMEAQKRELSKKIKGVARVLLAGGLIAGGLKAGTPSKDVSAHAPATGTVSVETTPTPIETPLYTRLSTSSLDRIIPRDETGSQFPNFENTTEALAFLEGEGGAKWIPGDPTEEITYFPWKNAETWETFRNLKSIGDEPHFVFLVPNKEGNKFSLVGVEPFYGNNLLDFVDSSGNPTTILVKGRVNQKVLLGEYYSHLSIYNISVWPDMSYPKGDCKSFTNNPSSGVTEGIACTVDGQRGHYFQAQSISHQK